MSKPIRNLISTVHDSAASKGAAMHALVAELFPIARSLTGDGNRKTLSILGREIPELTITEVPTGTRAFDWTVPQEWNLRDAWIECSDGRRICEFNVNNLHVVGYSTPIQAEVDFETLQAHLHSRPDLPDAVPYVTSYYKPTWGFCIADRERRKLLRGQYRVMIDSHFSDGSMSVGEAVLPGEGQAEILLSTYICHPSMANNELSGPTVAVALVKWLKSLPRRKYTYRFLFLPETIGSIWYISTHLGELRRRVVAGFVLTCCGDDRGYSFVPSRHGDTLADRAARHTLKHLAPDAKLYTFLDRGSDERQYCSPGVDLPVCSVMRTKYGTYPEYHTSLDDLALVTPEGLNGAFKVYREIITSLERNEVLRVTTFCEPSLSRRGFYPSVSTMATRENVIRLLNLIAYADGECDLLQLADTIECPIWMLYGYVDRLKREGLLKACC